MARTEQELSDDLDKISTGLAAVATEQAALQAQIAALQTAGAGAVTQAQLDDLAGRADSLVTAVQALVPPTAPATV